MENYEKSPISTCYHPLIYNIASDLELEPRIKPCTKFGPNPSRNDESVS